jgi:rhodanese-related sulfurtransferase
VATSTELRKLIEEGTKVLDVREADERRSGRFAGSTHVPVIQLPHRLDEVDRTRPILAHCAHGPRAASAASLLERAGFDSVSIFSGGMASWRTAGLELISG